MKKIVLISKNLYICNIIIIYLPIYEKCEKYVGKYVNGMVMLILQRLLDGGNILFLVEVF